MQSRDVGQYEVAKTICSYLEIEDLKTVRATSKICNDFLTVEKQLWISKSDLLCKTQLDILLVDETEPCMPKEKIKIDYENWIEILLRVKANGSIKDFVQVQPCEAN